MATVYFKPIASYQQTQDISDGARLLLQTLVERENVTLAPVAPLKVHFGEKGNQTFIGAKNFDGIIDYLRAQHVETCYMETNVLYRGERQTRAQHVKLAERHGFTQIPVVIADGETGDDYDEVDIGQKRFKSCKIGREIAKQEQLIVVSHFKGHGYAGFGGALKQLAMGCAARGGKLAQHADAIPFINPLACRKCHACEKHCPANAITIGRFPRIHRDKCLGCASCMPICPHHAILFNPLRATLFDAFREKMAEYALAAQKGKRNLYISFALNITNGCDCMGRKMTPIADDLGIFAATDPVAIDQACLDLLDQRKGKPVFKRGRNILEYAEQIGVGARAYDLVTLR